MSNLLSDLLGERDHLLADGATGTNMMAVGLPAGQAHLLAGCWADWQVAMVPISETSNYPATYPQAISSV
jgi:hypothetical protein